MTEEKEIHLRDYFRVIAKRRYTVYTFFAVVFALALIMTFSTRPLYKATTKVLIEKNEPANLATLNYYYAPYDPEFGETQFQLIKSSSVALRVVKMLSLDSVQERKLREPDSPGILGGTAAWFRGLFSAAPDEAGGKAAGKERADSGAVADVDPKTMNLARAVSGAVIVAPVKNSKLVNISYVSPDPELAARIVNSLVKAYMEEVLEIRMNTSRYAMKWLSEKADEEKAKLERSEQALQEYMRAKDIVTLENRLAMVPERLSEVATKIAEAETKRKELESLFSKIKDLDKDPERADTIPAISSDPTIQSLRQQILKAEQNIMELSKKFGPKHPAMVTAAADLKGLKEKKGQEVLRVINSIRNEYELAKANEETFRRLASQTKAETLNLSEKFIQYGALKREAETNKQLFDAILKRIKEQDITQDIQTVNIWVVERAEVPKSPEKPRKAMNILLGLVVGLCGGIGLAFFIEYLDNTIKSPEDAEAKLGVPVLGMISNVATKEKVIEDMVKAEPQSQVAESYRVIRTAILLSSAARPPRHVLITSISPGEGKTATSVNLAVTIAQSEHSVLLVDSDLRKPRLHRIFGLDNSRGLSTYLAGASDLGLVQTDLPNLSVIPSGPIPPNPSELLGSGKMQELLASLNERYDIVIWDSAPLLTVTDSLILSKLLDGTIIVVRAGETTYDGVRKGLKSLADIESHFLGVVLNGVELGKGGYYYHHYYDYYYRTPEERK